MLFFKRLALKKLLHHCLKVLLYKKKKIMFKNMIIVIYIYMCIYICVYMCIYVYMWKYNIIFSPVWYQGSFILVTFWHNGPIKKRNKEHVNNCVLNIFLNTLNTICLFTSHNVCTTYIIMKVFHMSCFLKHIKSMKGTKASHLTRNNMKGEWRLGHTREHQNPFS